MIELLSESFQLFVVSWVFVTQLITFTLRFKWLKWLNPYMCLKCWTFWISMIGVGILTDYSIWYTIVLSSTTAFIADVYSNITNR